jgi:hypothetical protein
VRPDEDDDGDIRAGTTNVVALLGIAALFDVLPVGVDDDDDDDGDDNDDLE